MFSMDLCTEASSLSRSCVYVYEGLQKATAQARFGGHALISNEISSMNDDVSCSLRMNQRKCFLKKKQLTLQRKNDSKESRG